MGRHTFGTKGPFATTSFKKGGGLIFEIYCLSINVAGIMTYLSKISFPAQSSQCLSYFVTASIILCGKEHMHTITCASELVCHEQHYLRPEVVAFCGGFVDANNKQELRRNGWLHCMSASFENACSPNQPADSDLAQQH